MFFFGSPNFLYLLFLLPLAILFFWVILSHLESIKRQFHAPSLSHLGKTSGRFRYARLTLWFVLGSASLILALADPQIEREQVELVYSKLDLVFLLDTSPSMRARDIVPSRIDRAREEIRNLIIHQGQNIGRVGLVNFSGSSMILSSRRSECSRPVALEKLAREYVLFFWDIEPWGLTHQELASRLGQDTNEAAAEALARALEDGEHCRYAADDAARWQQAFREDLEELKKLSV